MIFDFDTDDYIEATAALLVYVTYRSRNKQKFKVDKDMWGRIERFTKSCAKRAVDLPDFLEKFKRKMACESINPRYCDVGLNKITMIEGPHGELIHKADEGKRQFLTEILSGVDDQKVIDVLYQKTAYVILLVRDRLEREKPIEATIETLAIEGGEN